MTAEWRLEDIDFMIIGILCIIWLLTYFWRHFFRWDTRYGLKQSGTKKDGYRAFEPPFQRKVAAAVVVLDKPSLDPRKRGTWLVQGLLAAGFRVLLSRSANGAARALQNKDCIAIVHHGSITCKDEVATTITACIEWIVESKIPRAIFVNERGAPGLKACVDGLAMAFKARQSRTVECSLISCTNKPVLETELSVFHDILVVRKSKASLRDAELQAIGCLLRWLGT
ncbi:MAG: hypothetical protein Q6373_019400 [Candidatus Sigynarchaeota archaeon]